MVLEQLKLLINLARIDGEVGAREEKYIYNIAEANGVSRETVQPLLKAFHHDIVPRDLADDRKFDYIFSLVQLMKIDERLYQEEIRFCSRVAARLGYDQAVMFDLMLHVRGVMQANELEALRKLTAKYLSKS